MTVYRGRAQAKATYRYPPLSSSRIHGLYAAYEEVTNRTVWPSMRGLLLVCARIHGPDTMNLMQELYVEGGADDLLLRLREHPPRDTIAPLPREEAEAEAEVGGPDAKFTFEDVDEAIESSTPVSHRPARHSPREALR